MIDLNRLGGGKQYAHKILGLNVLSNPLRSEAEQKKLTEKLKLKYKPKQRPTKN